MNTQELLNKTMSGVLTSAEIDEVHNALIKNRGDCYELLLILGRAEAKQFKSTVEEYLNRYDDPMLVRLALQILCRYWGFAYEYKDLIANYLKLNEWDQDGDVRLMAIGCVTEVFKKGEDQLLLHEVFNIFRNIENDGLTRGTAYKTLAIISGMDIKDLPTPKNFRLERDVNPTIIEKVEKKLNMAFKR